MEDEAAQEAGGGVVVLVMRETVRGWGVKDWLRSSERWNHFPFDGGISWWDIPNRSRHVIQSLR